MGWLDKLKAVASNEVVQSWLPERKVMLAGLSSLATTAAVAGLSRGKTTKLSRKQARKLVTSLAAVASAVPPVVAYVTSNKPVAPAQVP